LSPFLPHIEEKSRRQSEDNPLLPLQARERGREVKLGILDWTGLNSLTKKRSKKAMGSV